MRRKFQGPDQSGYVLLPVVMAIVLIALIAFVLNRTTGVNVTTVAARTEILQARYVAEAGIAHAKWLLNNSCGETTITAIPFQGHTYDLQVQLINGSYHITSTGYLNTGVRSTIEADASCAPKNLFWAEWDGNNIWAADLDGNSPTAIATNSGNPIPLTVDPEDKLIYWRHGDKIRRAALNGSGVVDVVACGIACEASGLAIEPGNKIYWTNKDDNIRRANIDGSGIEILVSSGLNNPIGIDLDLSNGKMYWADEKNGAIKSANLDGTGVSIVLSFSPASKPRHIAVDSAGGKFYWYDQNSRILFRANLDGSGIETLISFAVDTTLRGIALDTGGGKIYWTNQGNGGQIGRANLDGSSIELVINTPLPWGVAVIPEN